MITTLSNPFGPNMFKTTYVRSTKITYISTLPEHQTLPPPPAMTHLHQGFIGTRRADLLPLQQLNTQTSKGEVDSNCLSRLFKRFVPVLNVSTVSVDVYKHTSYVFIICVHIHILCV